VRRREGKMRENKAKVSETMDVTCLLCDLFCDGWVVPGLERSVWACSLFPQAQMKEHLRSTSFIEVWATNHILSLWGRVVSYRQQSNFDLLHAEGVSRLNIFRL
jgi:hypothetical protein